MSSIHNNTPTQDRHLDFLKDTVLIFVTGALLLVVPACAQSPKRQVEKQEASWARWSIPAEDPIPDAK